MPPGAATGRRRRFCSDRCRHAAKYERRQVIASWDAGGVGLVPVADPSVAEPVVSATVDGLVSVLSGGRSGDAVGQVARAIVEARVLSASLARLGREGGLPLQLAWRCVQLSDAITGSVRECFGEVVDGA